MRVTLTPPNSEAVVCPASTAPPRSRMRWTIVDVAVAIWSANGTEAWVYGQPATSSSSLTPIGTPPNGSETSATPAAIVARSRSTWLKAFSGLASIAANTASSSSTGERSPRRKASTSEQASPVHGVSPMRSERSRRTGATGNEPSDDRPRIPSGPDGHPHVPRAGADAQPVPLEAAGDDGHLRPAATSCSAAPGSGRRSRRWRARRGARRSGRRRSTCPTPGPARSSTSTSSSPSRATR